MEDAKGMPPPSAPRGRSPGALRGRAVAPDAVAMSEYSELQSEASVFHSEFDEEDEPISRVKAAGCAAPARPSFRGLRARSAGGDGSGSDGDNDYAEELHRRHGAGRSGGVSAAVTLQKATMMMREMAKGTTLGDSDDVEDIHDAEYDRDYRAIPALDMYERRNLDNREYDDITADAKRAAEADMRRRDRREMAQSGRAGGARLPAALQEDASTTTTMTTQQPAAEWRSVRRVTTSSLTKTMLILRSRTLAMCLSLSGSLRTARVQRLRSSSATFCEPTGTTQSSSNGNGPIPPTGPTELALLFTRPASTPCVQPTSSRSRSIMSICPTRIRTSLCGWRTCPRQCCRYSTMWPRRSLNSLSPTRTSTARVLVRIGDLPIKDKLRDLRQEHLHQLVRVEGVVTRRTSVFPQLKLLRYRCLECDELLDPSESRQHPAAQANVLPSVSEREFSPRSRPTRHTETTRRSHSRNRPVRSQRGGVAGRKDVLVGNDLIDATPWRGGSHHRGVPEHLRCEAERTQWILSILDRDSGELHRKAGCRHF